MSVNVDCLKCIELYSINKEILLKLLQNWVRYDIITFGELQVSGVIPSRR